LARQIDYELASAAPDSDVMFVLDFDRTLPNGYGRPGSSGAAGVRGAMQTLEALEPTTA